MGQINLIPQLPQLPIEQITLILWFVVLGVGYLGWVMYFVIRSDIQQNAPFLMDILLAAKKELPVLFVSHPKTNEIDVHVGTRTDKSSCKFDIKDMHLLFTPDSSSNIQPDRIGKLKIYHAEYLNPELMSRTNAIALNNIRNVRDRFPKLRFLSNQDLHSLLSRPAGEWIANCETVLACARDQNMPDEAIPEDKDEFVLLMNKARAYISSSDCPLYNATELGTTYETVQVQKILPLPKQTKNGIFEIFEIFERFFRRNISDNPQPVEPSQPVEPKYIYQNAYRIPCGLQLYSWGYAFDTNSSAATSRHMEQYGLEIEARTRMNLQNANQEMMMKLISILFPIGIFCLLCGLAVYFGSLVLHK